MRFIQLMKNGISHKYFLLLILLIINSCGDAKKDEQKEIILARVGDKTISLNEFMRRSEYTIRPAYCKGDNNLHKKIILNSLIAEKMLAFEAGEIKDLDQKKYFQMHIQGRQEQAMREWLLHEEGFQKVQIEESEIQKVYNIAGRTYNVQYFNIPDDSIAAILNEEYINEPGRFEVLHQQLWQNEAMPEREIAWKSQEHPMIHDALFADSIARGLVIGPMRISDNNHIVMKVMGWTDDLAVSENDRKQRWNDVKEKLTREKALQIYDKYVVSIMEGKRLDFDRQTFNKMVNLIGPMYMRSPEEKREFFLNATFNRSAENPELDHLAEGIDAILDDSFFRVEGQVWSVRDFKEELQRHPLVFRKNLPKDTKFAEHFRFAIVDMIRDKYLTQEAYKRGYQDVDVVKRNKEMWHDALIAQYQKNQYLKNRVSNLSDSLNTLVMIRDYLNPYIDQLQKKYSDRIQVNVEQFNKIRLTRVDMIVMQKNVPFPVIVPSFPQVTTDSKLDYGKRIK
jgi:hypothetical protein